MSVVKSHTLSIGIVGLPNAGKSTLFNSLTRNSVPAENFPFCTIDKNVGVVQVPDERLDRLENFYKAEKKVPSAIKFVDIAGLVKGASKGEGLGNKFLSHIREVDVIMYVLRAFKSETISHVYERIDPADDIEIVEAELLLKDIETVERKLGEVEKKARTDDEAKVQVDMLKRLLPWLSDGKAANDFDVDEDEAEFLRDLWLLTNKKRLYCLNIKQGSDASERDVWREKLMKYVGGDQYIMEVDVKSLGQITGMPSAEYKQYLELLGDEKPTTADDIIKMAFDRLGLITFYTGSEKEVNAWSIGRGATIKEAAGVIHTDLMQGFITADVVNVDEMVKIGGLVEAREKGIVRDQGKGYVVEDGDYILVYAN